MIKDEIEAEIERLKTQIMIAKIKLIRQEKEDEDAEVDALLTCAYIISGILLLIVLVALFNTYVRGI